METLVSLDVSANYLSHSPTACDCVEYQETLHLTVSNTVIHPADLFLRIEKAIFELKIPGPEDHIRTFQTVKCRQVRNVIAFYILDALLHNCTNSSEMQLSNASLLIFQFSFDYNDVCLQF